MMVGDKGKRGQGFKESWAKGFFGNRHLRPGTILILCILSLTLLLPLSGVTAAALTELEAKGKKIYFEGVSPSGDPINAYISAGRIKLPGARATCASCHGPDGKGRPEAGVIPSDITWENLTKPYGHSHQDGRKHPAFTDTSLKKCILTGFDPAGNRLDASMPLYEMGEAELSALVAYIRRLRSDLDPGLTEKLIRIGTLVPGGGPMAGHGDAVLSILKAYFDDLNSRGGIYGRKVELVTGRFSPPQVTVPRALEDLAKGKGVFAMVAPVIAGSDRDAARFAEEESIPIVGPLTLLSPDPMALNTYTFYIYSGVREEALVLARFALERVGRKAPRFALICPEGSYLDPVKESVATVLQDGGALKSITVDSRGKALSNPSLPTSLMKKGVDALFLFGTAGASTFMNHASKAGWHPYIFVPGPLAGSSILEAGNGFQGKIFLSYPTLPSDRNRAGVEALASLMKGHNISRERLSAKVSAFVSARLMEEGLKRSGRNLSRDSLVKALEGLYRFDTGLTPLISFGANRRVGALGGYVVGVDLKTKGLKPLGDWIPLE